MIEFILAPAAIPTLVVAATLFCTGLAVLARERRSAVSLSFFVVTTGAAVWLTGVSLMYMSVNASAAITLARVTYVGITILPAALLHFTAALIDETRRRRTLLAGAWIGAVVFLLLFVGTPYFITGVYRYPWGYYPRLGVPSVFFLLYFGALLGTSLYVLRRALRSELTGAQRHRYGAFSIALAVGYLASVDYFPSFGIAVYPMGYVAVVGFVVLATRAIRRFRLVDLSPSFVAEHLLETVHGGVIVIDHRGRVRVANDIASSLLGYSAGKLAGENLAKLLGIPTLPAFESQTFARVGRTRNRPMTWRRRDGSTVDVSVSATMLRDGDGLPVGILYAIHDLTEQRRAEQHEFAANHDLLTRLPNRTFFAARFDQVVEDATTHARVPAVFFLDLDGFKAINDRLGHATGDRVLQIVASRVRNAMRQEDVVARFGGDEFVALVSLRSIDDAPLVARKLEAVVRSPMSIDGRELTVGASVGYAAYGNDLRTLEMLLAAADQSMYRAKSRHPHPARLTSSSGKDDVAMPSTGF